MKVTDLLNTRPTAPTMLLLLIILLVRPGLAPGDEIPLPGQNAPIALPGEGPAENHTDTGFLPTFGGYVENTLNAEHMTADDSINTLNNTKVRLNLSGDVAPFLGFGMGLIGETNAGQRAYHLTAYLPEEDEATIPEENRHAYTDEMKKNDVYLQEAFLTLTASTASFRVGRHKFYSGTGYAYNPMDLFNKKDPLDPTYETRGQDAAMLSLEVSASSELELTARTDEDHRHVDSQMRLTHYRSGWDLALQYTRYTDTRVDWEGDGRHVDFTWDLLAAEFSGEIAGVGLHGEGGYAFIDEPEDPGTLSRAGKDHERFLLGMDYTFEWQLYVLLEYLRFGQGRDDTDEMTLNDRFAYLTGEILTSNKDTLYLGLTYPVTDLTDISLYTIVNCNDPSLTLSPWLEWNAHPGWDVSLSLNIPAGAEDASPGRTGTSGFVRVRYSF
ncbi:hypothetical protein [Desulfoluna spongiiphila]|uniref:hypothetical protein n=1 Tax=Desulfoluna spongiiphila TaxID=419481 RepID=UPI0012541501|nr:hypothetical protein [Desulfoluna spongiiphila]VVS94323.1 hypothetical protein DBB_38950 [Desulfoluna spongiiphila]